MNQLFKIFIKNTPIYYILYNKFSKIKQTKELEKWKQKGEPDPPPHIIKQKTLKTYANKFGLKILVETGTYYGDMIEAMKNDFDTLYSIELSKELYTKAKKRFRKEKHIKLIQGDSGIELINIVNTLTLPTLFWLDGHYSCGETAKGIKDTPIIEELSYILDSQEIGHVIIIDDARCFGSNTDYPSIDELKIFIRSKRPNANIDISNDSIKITPG